MAVEPALVHSALKEELVAITSGRVKFNEPMRWHTTFHIGGPAEIWADPVDRDQLRRLLPLAQEANLPVTVVGGGANLLVRDGGIPGLVLHLGVKNFETSRRTPHGLLVGAGFPLEGLIHRAQEEGLSGVEFLAGVPGRVGGAVRMNAGTHDDEGQVHAFGDVVRSVTVMDLKGQIQTIPKEEVGFTYRSTQLKDRIVLEADLVLADDDPQAIAGRVKRLWEFKRRTQDWSAPSVGCIFKNPPQGPSAGRMIDELGFKGYRIGGAQVSSVHANFIMNRGQAQAADVLKLIEEIQYRVRQDFKMDLELEVRVIP